MVHLSKVIAPSSAISDLRLCDTATAAATPVAPPVGCRVLELVYGMVGGTAERALSARLWTANAGAAVTTATTVAAYGYDANAQLVGVSDPRVAV